MQRTSIREALASTGPRNGVTVCGWVRTRRDSKGFAFLELNDGSCLKNLQCIVDEGTQAWNSLEGVNTGAAVSVTGDLVESPGKGQKWEVHADSMTVFGLADPAAYPLQKKRHSDEFLRTIAHLRPRTNKYGAAFRIRSEAALAVHDYFRGLGFYYVHAPILTGSDCEGAGEMFRVTTLPVDGGPKPESGNVFENDFFGKQASLTVSGQLERKRWPARSAACTTSAPPSAPSIPTRRATPPNSGWSNPKPPSTTSGTTWNWPKVSSDTWCATPWITAPTTWPCSTSSLLPASSTACATWRKRSTPALPTATP